MEIISHVVDGSVRAVRCSLFQFILRSLLCVVSCHGGDVGWKFFVRFY